MYSNSSGCSRSCGTASAPARPRPAASSRGRTAAGQGEHPGGPRVAARQLHEPQVRRHRARACAGRASAPRCAGPVGRPSRRRGTTGDSPATCRRTGPPAGAGHGLGDPVAAGGPAAVPAPPAAAAPAIFSRSRAARAALVEAARPPVACAATRGLATTASRRRSPAPAAHDDQQWREQRDEAQADRGTVLDRRDHGGADPDRREVGDRTRRGLPACTSPATTTPSTTPPTGAAPSRPSCPAPSPPPCRAEQPTHAGRMNVCTASLIESWPAPCRARARSAAARHRSRSPTTTPSTHTTPAT